MVKVIIVVCRSPLYLVVFSMFFFFQRVKLSGPGL